MKYLLFLPLLLVGCLEVKMPKPIVAEDDSEAVSVPRSEPTATPKPKKEEVYVRGADRDVDEPRYVDKVVDGEDNVDSVSDQLKSCEKDNSKYVDELDFLREINEHINRRNNDLAIYAEDLERQNSALRAQLQVYLGR